MKTSLNFAIIVLFTGILPCLADSFSEKSSENFSSPIDFKGTAYDLKHHNEVYTEEYRETYQLINRQNKHLASLTCYRDPQGNDIAERHLDFSQSDVKPAYHLKDLRTGYEEGANVASSNGPDDQVHVFYRDSKNSALKEKNLKVSEPCVIDGGFNNFLKQNWNELVSGKHIRFNFIAASQLNYFAFVARESDSTATTRTFSIEVDNFVLHLLVPPIIVTYNFSTKMMTQYQGISNINDDKGKSLKVKLIYPDKGP